MPLLPTSSAIAISFMLMPVINPHNQKLRTGMTRSSWCALSWSRRLATAGFWLSPASQIWERGLTRERQGDVFFRYESKLVHIHYLTVVVHPLSATYMDHGERVDHSHALGEAVRKKEKIYDSALTMMRSAGACRAGLRKGTFLPCLHLSWRG